MDRLFKGKRYDNGEWVYGGYFCDGDRHYIITEVVTKSMVVYAHCSDLTHMYIVDQATVCQYTGIDDIYGNKIWENDYVICKHYVGDFVKYNCQTGYIEMKAGSFGLHRKFVDQYGNAFNEYFRPLVDLLECYEIGVVGNIFDDPDLIK